MSLRSLAARRSVGREWLRRRHTAGVALLSRRLPPPKVPGGKLIAVIDGLWFRFCGVEHALYLLLLRPVRGRTAVLRDPLLFQGHESLAGWRQLVAGLTPRVRSRIVALVSDGLTGIESLAEEQGWVLQRCHFHLLAQLQHFRGRKNHFVSVRSLWEEIYQTARRILRARTEMTAQRHVRHLRRLLAHPECPRWLARRTRGFSAI